MRETMTKYKNHLVEEPWIFNKIDCDYVKWLNNIAGEEKRAEIFKMKKLYYSKFKWYVGQ